jgi:lipid A 4'-phosphatase
MNKALTFRIVILMLCAVSGLVLFIFPEIDLHIASLFYSDSFYLADQRVVQLVYLVFAKIHLLYLLLLIIAIAIFSFKALKDQQLKSIYLLVALLLGPGLAVNVALKDNSIGRARPVQTFEFGGHAPFTPAFVYSGACNKNCSFVSGHAAIGFFAVSLYWLQRRRRWIIIGIAMGATVGLGRIIQGGHYFSDVVFAGWTVWYCSSVCAYFFGLNRRTP